MQESTAPYLCCRPEVAVRALVAGRAVLPDDVCDQLGGGGSHAAAVAALQPPEPVDQFLRGLIQQKLFDDQCPVWYFL